MQIITGEKSFQNDLCLQTRGTRGTKMQDYLAWYCLAWFTNQYTTICHCWNLAIYKPVCKFFLIFTLQPAMSGHQFCLLLPPWVCGEILLENTFMVCDAGAPKFVPITGKKKSLFGGVIKLSLLQEHRNHLPYFWWIISYLSELLFFFFKWVDISNQLECTVIPAGIFTVNYQLIVRWERGREMNQTT